MDCATDLACYPSDLLREKPRERGGQAVVSSIFQETGSNYIGMKDLNCLQSLTHESFTADFIFSMQLVLEDELSSGGSTDTIDISQSSSPALRVNNNMLVDWEEFSDVVGRLLVDPASNLRWLDLSFNDLRTIDSVSQYQFMPAIKEYPRFCSCQQSISVV